MTLRLTDEQDAKLAEMATKLGCSKHQAVLRAIEAFDSKAARQKELKKILDEVLVRDKELLDRLADA